MTVQIEVVPAEALVVGPDEVLIIHIKDDQAFGPGETTNEVLGELNEILVAAGLKDRSLILMGEAFLLAKAAR